MKDRSKSAFPLLRALDQAVELMLLVESIFRLGNILMTHLTFDGTTMERLQATTEFVKIQDESGKVIGYFHPLHQQATSRSPHTREELEQLRLQRTGRPLADILADLGAS